MAAMLAASVALTAGRGHAQAPSGGAPAGLIPIPTRTYVGINPLGLPWDIGTVEIESGVAPGTTVGGVASYVDLGDERFTSFEGKLRYYPGDVVLRGFSVGASGGYTRFSNIVKTTRESLSAPTIGILADYNWLYGRAQHFLIGTGVGAKRVLASSAERDRVDLPRAIVTGRLIVGFAF